MTKLLRELLERGTLTEIEGVAAAESLLQTIGDKDERARALLLVAKALAVAGQLDEAQSLAREIESSYDKANAFREIAIELLNADKRFEAVKFLFDAEEAAQGDVAWVWQRAEALSRIAGGFAGADQHLDAQRVWDMAIAVARSGEQEQDIQESVDCSSVLWEIAEALAGSGEFAKAEDVAKAIKNSGKRDKAISGVQRIARKNRDDPGDQRVLELS